MSYLTTLPEGEGLEEKRKGDRRTRKRNRRKTGVGEWGRQNKKERKKESNRKKKKKKKKKKKAWELRRLSRSV